MHKLRNKYDITPYLEITTTSVVRALTAAATGRREREEGVNKSSPCYGIRPTTTRFGRNLCKDANINMFNANINKLNENINKLNANINKLSIQVYKIIDSYQTYPISRCRYMYWGVELLSHWSLFNGYLTMFRYDSCFATT